MPLDLHAPIITPWNRLYTGEVPRTRFVDWLDAIQVELKHGPDRSRIFAGMAEMQQASYTPDYDEVIERAQAAVEAGSYGAQPLPLNLEVPSFLFVIRGVSRVMTHQIVRARIAVTYAQKCTGDGDIRHDDVLVPRSLNRDEIEAQGALRWYIDHHLGFKHWYAHELDHGRQSFWALRYAMPHSLAQFIYVNISLSALRLLYGKRACTEQPIEWQSICAGIKRALEAEYPEFAALLVPDCASGRCFYHRHGVNDPRIGRLFFPDAQHDTAPWHPSSFIHGSREEYLDGPPFVTETYRGFERVDEVLA